MKYFQFLLIVFTILIISVQNLTCGEEDIDHCLECGTGNKANSCAKCEDKYFPFLSDVLCLPCDHYLYGQTGCGGKCTKKNYVEQRMVFCEENGCKQGYYNIEGICHQCSIGSDHCTNCTYLPPKGFKSNETDERFFKCLGCESNQYRIEQHDGRCHHCYISGCEICHFENNNAVCDKCRRGYYLNSHRTCSDCYWTEPVGGDCYICSDNPRDYATGYCYCDSGYTKNKLVNGITNPCIRCPENCRYCTYYPETGENKCHSCYYGMTLNSEGKCVGCEGNCGYCDSDVHTCNVCEPGYQLNIDNNCLVCPKNCSSCRLDSNGEIYCTSCDYQYGLTPERKCLKCPDHCNYCFWKTSTNSFGCSQCESPSSYSFQQNYIVGKDDICIRCQDITEIGINGGCIQCYYDKYLSKEYKCTRCLGDTRGLWTWKWIGRKWVRVPWPDDPVKNFAYVLKEYKCLPNTVYDPESIHGCLESQKDPISGRYLCNTCKREFIQIVDDKKCLTPTEADLSPACAWAKNLQTLNDPLYSCLNCLYNIRITDHRGKVDCVPAVDELIRCTEAIKYANGTRQCISCVHNYQFIYSETYHQMICDNKCDTYSYFRWSWCYKCNDTYVGNPGCKLVEESCNWNPTNDQLNCKECIDGYFKFTYGQCLSCSALSRPCTKCHKEEGVGGEDDKYICEDCADGYFINNEKKCQIITCDEYPEITKGCVICINKINQYKPYNKCQSCTEDFFKTKDESCVYCKARKNGGPACELCKYEEGTDNIICSYCPKGKVMSKDGKCYDCKEELGDACLSCSFSLDEDNNEQLKCNKCKSKYNLSPNGHCIHYQSYYEFIPHCANTVYEIISGNFNNDEEINNTSNTNNSNICEDCGDYNDYGFSTDIFYSDETNTENEEPSGENNNMGNNFQIISNCSKCKSGYYKKDGKCERLNVNECSFLSIINSLDLDKLEGCLEFCQNKEYTSINYYYDNIIPLILQNPINTSIFDGMNFYATLDMFGLSENMTGKVDLEYILHSMNPTAKYQLTQSFDVMKTKLNAAINLFNGDFLSLLVKAFMCMDNSGIGEKTSPKNLRKCKITEYNEINNSFTCSECVLGYSLDNETQTCKQSIKISFKEKPGLSNCYTTNLGTKQNPKLSCYKCYSPFDLLVESESGINFCVTPYNYDYRFILQNPVYELEGCTKATVDTNYITDTYNCTDCEYGYIPYVSKFYKRKICQYIYEDIIRTKSDFASESFIGVENVSAVNGTCPGKKLFTPDNKTCYACNNRAVGMVGCKGSCTFSVKTNNVLECQEGGCKTGYLEKSKGICEPCDTVNIGCIECHYDENYLSDYQGLKWKRRFVCDQCDEGSLMSEDGTCHNCSELGFKNCDKCKVNDDGDLLCYKCLEDFFLTDEGECTKCNSTQVRGNGNKCITCDNMDDGGIEGCSRCQNENDSIICNECKDGFLFLDGNKTCLKLSQDEELEEFVNCIKLDYINDKLQCIECNNGYVLLNENDKIRCVSNSFIPSHNININQYCHKEINLGTEDKPKYSCEKCIEKSKINAKKDFIKITFEANQTSYCDYQSSFSKLENCTNANLKVINGVINLNCTQCDENSILKYHVDTNSYICRYVHYEKNCVVKYCKTCRRDNNYFCQECLPADYEVNPITGTCVKKSPRVPAITWKDMYRLQMNQQRVINGRQVYGPTLMMRGLTNCQINSGHAFLVYLVFQIKYTRRNIRNLEEEKKIPTICQVVDSVDESEDELNIVEYDCIGNLTEDENEELNGNYEINGIEENSENNFGVLSESNLNNLAKQIDFKTLDKKTEPAFGLGDALKTSMFIIDEFKNFTTDNYKFDILIDGKLNNELEQKTLDIEIPVTHIDKNAECKFNIKENKTANLNCKLNIEQYRTYSNFSFKVVDIDNDGSPIFLSRINEIYLFNEGNGAEKSINEDDNDHKTLIIVLSVIGGVIVIAAIVTGIVVYRIKKRRVNISEIDLKVEDKNLQNVNNDVVYDSSQRGIKKLSQLS
ncbi:MAG: hypothetical protein J6O41_03055 [Clostridia bacterium]|nr:hypothetical protein [Clostridia bacterium]